MLPSRSKAAKASSCRWKRNLRSMRRRLRSTNGTAAARRSSRRSSLFWKAPKRSKSRPPRQLPADDGSLASDFNSISEDGKHLYFTAKAISEREAGHSAEEATFNIYDRVEGTHTVKISATANPGLEDTGARFEGASSNGERVFFLANHGLTPGGGASTTAGCTTQSGETQLAASAGCDLYEYRHEGEGGHLTDLTPTSTGVEGANVTGVAGIASNGEYVYFTSSGKLDGRRRPHRRRKRSRLPHRQPLRLPRRQHLVRRADQSGRGRERPRHPDNRLRYPARKRRSTR